MWHLAIKAFPNYYRIGHTTYHCRAGVFKAAFPLQLCVMLWLCTYRLVSSNISVINRALILLWTFKPAIKTLKGFFFDKYKIGFPVIHVFYSSRNKVGWLVSKIPRQFKDLWVQTRSVQFFFKKISISWFGSIGLTPPNQYFWKISDSNTSMVFWSGIFQKTQFWGEGVW